MEAGIAFQGDEANAIRVGADDRLMIDVGVGFIQIARIISTAFVKKRARQNLKELRAAMSMRRELQAGPPFKQQDLGVGVSRERDFAPPEAWSEPAPGADLAVAQRGGEFQSDGMALPGDD